MAIACLVEFILADQYQCTKYCNDFVAHCTTRQQSPSHPLVHYGCIRPILPIMYRIITHTLKHSRPFQVQTFHYKQVATNVCYSVQKISDPPEVFPACLDSCKDLVLNRSFHFFLKSLLSLSTLFYPKSKHLWQIHKIGRAHV